MIVMIERVHLCCDNCERDEIQVGLSQPGWARVSVDLDQFHFCPACWQSIAAQFVLEHKK
jgi:hypothetical protein